MFRHSNSPPGIARTMISWGLTVIVMLCFAGCNSSSKAPVALPSQSSWKQTGATYVGTSTCSDCHAKIAAQYATSAKVVSAGATRHSTVATTGATAGTACLNCHVTGPEQFTGFNANGQILASAIPDYLKGIGCEDCHGPGSKHAKSVNKADITRTPPAKITCENCHGGRPYNSAHAPEVFVNDDFADLKNATTQSIRGPHNATASFLIGRFGYNITEAMPSPHSTLPNTCVDCHKPGVDATTGKIDHLHWGVPNLDTTRAECSSCHHGTRNVAMVQDSVVQQMIKLGGAATNGTDPYNTNGTGGLLQAYYTSKSVAALFARVNTNVTTNNVDAYTGFSDSEKLTLNKYRGAMWNFKTIIADHSTGVHNPAFAQKLLNDAVTLLQ